MSEREMSEQDTQHSLGQLIDDRAKRDAVHIAVAPGRAAERLAPGEHIGRVNEEVFGRNATHIGIVDPFLTGPVFTLKATAFKQKKDGPAAEGLQMTKPLKSRDTLRRLERAAMKLFRSQEGADWIMRGNRALRGFMKAASAHAAKGKRGKK